MSVQMHNPTHPGEVPKELCLEPLGLPITEAASGLGVSRKTMFPYSWCEKCSFDGPGDNIKSKDQVPVLNEIEKRNKYWVGMHAPERQASRRMRQVVAKSCVLVPQMRAHASEMFGVLSDPAIYEFENEPPPSEEWLATQYEHLESRVSADGTQKWLNWVVRLPQGQLAGYVQATVLPSFQALVAYELNSRYWRRGIGSAALRAMLEELRTEYGVCRYIAVLKARNFRSRALLGRLGFEPAGEIEAAARRDEQDELVMVKAASEEEDAI